jgi:DNA polymerase III sliding clamp (beta) subunit (PCNA family)
MEMVVRKTDLLRELQLFQGIVERKNTIPILANVLIEAMEKSNSLRRIWKSAFAAGVTRRWPSVDR